jgi:hypothetical protein
MLNATDKAMLSRGRWTELAVIPDLRPRVRGQAYQRLTTASRRNCRNHVSYQPPARAARPTVPRRDPRPPSWRAALLTIGLRILGSTVEPGETPRAAQQRLIAPNVIRLRHRFLCLCGRTTAIAASAQ